MLTRGQRRTYDFIKDFVDQNEFAPTAAEIAAGIGIKSRGVVHRYLKALEEADRIALIPKRHRNIKLIDTAAQFSAKGCVPLIGAIAAGEPIEAIADADPIDVSELFLGEGHYALRVKGDSMIDEGIFDGDIVVCKQAKTARNGQIVVALIDQQQATLKRFQQKNGMIILHPANQDLSPMLFDSSRVTIQGTYIGLLRIQQ